MTGTFAIQTQEEAQQRGAMLADNALKVRVVDAGTCAQADDLLAALKSMQKEIKRVTDPVVEAAHAAHKQAKKMQNDALAPLETAEAHLKRQRGEWTLAERAREDEDRKRREAEERKRIEADRLAQTERMIERGVPQEIALENLDRPIAVSVDAGTSVPKSSTTSVVEVWRAVIVDAALVPREYCVPDEKALNALAKATKGAHAVPGVVFQKEAVVRSRAY